MVIMTLLGLCHSSTTLKILRLSKKIGVICVALLYQLTTVVQKIPALVLTSMKMVNTGLLSIPATKMSESYTGVLAIKSSRSLVCGIY